MPKIYNQDLRDRAVNHWQKTGNKSQTARLFEINRNTLHDWIKLYQEQGNTKPNLQTLRRIKWSFKKRPRSLSKPIY